MQDYFFESRSGAGLLLPATNAMILLPTQADPAVSHERFIIVAAPRIHHPRENKIMNLNRLFLGLLVLSFACCERSASTLLQGYVEGEFVYVAAPSGGRLEKLHVQRGMNVEAGEPLFSLEAVAERASRDEAAHRLQQAKATLEDAGKGRRASEIEALRAGLMLAEDALALSRMEFARQETLRKTGAVSIDSIDRARSAYAQDQHRVEQLEAELKTAQLGARPDQIAALESEVKARESALTKADWDLSQKQQKAAQAAVVDDTLYREGEMVLAGRPVVTLLPPQNIKVRTFVPQDRISTLQVGAKAKVTIDGIAEALNAKVSFISPQAEYTPPVIYSQENRAKFVIMVELKFDDAVAAKLHPGQPVDVEFAP